MKPSIILICFLFLSRCSSVQKTANYHTPVLLVQHPFPAIPNPFSKLEILLAADIYIREDGSIGGVILRTGSGYADWDSVVVETIRTWEYAPMRLNDTPVACWVHQKMKVKITEPILYSLSAILFPSYEIADSFYTYLIEGRKFEEAAYSVSLFPRLGKYIEIGKVDIHQYSDIIRNNLTKLSEGEFTKPIKYDDHYIIFKRSKTNNF